MTTNSTIYSGTADQELVRRTYDARCRLFAHFGLQFDRCSRTAMRTTLHKIVTELPKPLVKLIKAGAAEAAQEKLKEANFDAWYDGVIGAVQHGEIKYSEAERILIKTGSKQRRMRVVIKTIGDEIEAGKASCSSSAVGLRRRRRLR